VIAVKHEANVNKIINKCLLGKKKIEQAEDIS